MGLHGITYAVEINWAGDATSLTDGTYVDEVGYVIDASIRRGRNDELGVTEAGRMTLIMNNNSGRFSPEYASGALYGNLQPYRRIRLKATFSAVTYTRFTGFITAIRPNGMSRECVIECEDLFLFLRNYHLNMPLQSGVLTGELIEDVLDEVGIATADYDCDAGQTVIPTWYARNTDALTAVQDLADHDLGGVVFIAGDGTFTYRDRHARAQEASQATISGPPGLVYDRGDSNLFNKVILQAGGFEAGIPGSVIWSQQPLPLLVPAADTEVIINPNFWQQSTDVIEPVSGTDWIANDAADGSGTDRTSEFTESPTYPWESYGGGAQWRLVKTRPRDMYLTQLKQRGTPMGLPTHLRDVTRTVAGSILPFDRAFQRSYPWISDRSLLGDFADYITQNYSDPQPRIVVTLLPDASATIVQMLAREIGERMTITDTTFAYSSQVDGDFFIESIEERINPRQQAHTTIWQMTTFLNDQFWIMGTSALDEDAILAY